MSKQRPSNLAVLTIVAFTASCVGLLIFLWISFGGSLPFSAQGYRFSVEFDQATELAPGAQVTIAGVDVGHVVSVRLDKRTGLDRAVLEVDRKYEPRPADTRAILRQKTLLGETYVALSAGDASGPRLRDGGRLPRAQVAPTVQLDQILDTFDPSTRRAFETWMQQGGIALTNRGEDFNVALGSLYPFATNVGAVLAVLGRDSAATRTLLADSGQVFSALSASPATLESFVRNANATFAATAARNAELAATIRAFPAFLRQGRTTVDRVGAFAATAKPLVDELHPAARALSPALVALNALAPKLDALSHDVAPATAAARTGLPALRRFLTVTEPFLGRLKPYLGNFVPVIDYLSDYRRELAAFFANSAAATEATGNPGSGPLRHYLRISTPINPETLATYAERPSSNRANPYLGPGGYLRLLSGLPVFGTYLCTDHPVPTVPSGLRADGGTTTTLAGAVLTITQLVQRFYLTADPSGPACRAQPSLGRQTTGQSRAFPSLKARP